MFFVIFIRKILREKQTIPPKVIVHYMLLGDTLLARITNRHQQVLVLIPWQDVLHSTQYIFAPFILCPTQPHLLKDKHNKLELPGNNASSAVCDHDADKSLVSVAFDYLR